MKRLFLLLMSLVVAPLAMAQSAPISGMALSQFGQPIPFAKIRICSVTSTGIPCQPIAPGGVFQDYTLLVPAPNPYTADQYGNYTVYVPAASPDLYVVQISADQGLTWTYVQNGPTGTISSVGLTMPSIFTVTGSPLINNGVIGVTFQGQGANVVFAGPTTGTGQPLFRPLVPADLPVAGSSTLGIVRADGTTISNTAGVLAVIGGVSGVTKITPGTNVTCTPLVSGGCVGNVTINSTGGGGGSGVVGPGAVDQLPVYTGTTTVHGDSLLLDSGSATAATAHLLYTGGGGAQFSTTNGGIYSLSTQCCSGTPPGGLTSQINLSTDIESTPTTTAGAGVINITTKDNIGLDNAANINIGASLTAAGTPTNSTNVNITANGFYPNGSGFVNLSGSGITIQDGGGGTVISTNGTSSVIELDNNSLTGAININAVHSGGTGAIQLIASNIALDGTGNLGVGGTLSATSLSIGPGCLFSDVTGKINTTGAPCGSGGGGGIGGSGTIGFFALYSGSTTTIGNGHLDDGISTAGLITSSESLVIADSTGFGGSLTGVFGPAPTASSSVDTFWADSGGRWKMNNANNGALYVPGLAALGVSGNCPKFASNGVDFVDSGVPCAGGAASTPTRTIDSGAGTGATVTFVAGANDNTGWINITTGTSPSASAGVVTVNYGGTYAAARKCTVDGSNPATAALSGNAKLFVPQSTSSNTNFVIQVGSTPLSGSTAYQAVYSCGT